MKKILLTSLFLLGTTLGLRTPGAGAMPPKVLALATVSDVVTAANAFLATLSTAQRSTVVKTRTKALAINWSNLPCGSSCRNGLQLTSSLTAAQLTAALAVVQAATGTNVNEGFSETNQIRAADANLNANASSQNASAYGSGIYFISFLVQDASSIDASLSAPSTTSTWQLQFGGHHLAVNKTYVNGVETGPTPQFEGVEPKSFTLTAATTIPGATLAAGTYGPLTNEHDRMTSMIASLTTAQKATAKLSSTFSDVILGPNQDGKFPTTKVGVACSTLSATQKALVLAAMKPWVTDDEDTNAATLLANYASELNSTYIAYSGTGLFTTNTDYARIDGPHVWIEFVCQSGVVYSSQIHYHSIWRDHTRDYGNSYTF
ncbi:MAG: DUF3500 domain-containing protein [Janthinobacterium lividum]